jgi:hypothetical protein
LGPININRVNLYISELSLLDLIDFIGSLHFDVGSLHFDVGSLHFDVGSLHFDIGLLVDNWSILNDGLIFIDGCIY